MIAWLRQHLQSLQQTLARFAGAPFATAANIIVVGTVLALPLGAYTLLINLQILAGSLPTEPQISIFLAPGQERSDVTALESRLRGTPGVRAVRFVPREAALASLKRVPGLADVINSLQDNPLPDAFVVSLASSGADLSIRLESQFKGLPGVGTVQVDSAWVRRVESLLHIARTVALLLGVLLGVALVAVTFNTIRLQTLTQREEIEVSKLVGATDAYVRRPFYYLGTLLGLGGGLVALGVVQGIIAVLDADLAQLGPIFGILPGVRFIMAGDALSFLLFSAVLGWLGTHLSVSRHLLSIQPL